MIQTVSAIASEIGSYPRYEEEGQKFASAKGLETTQELFWRENFEPVETDVSSSGVQINRTGDIQLYPFTDFFQGFENVEAVRSIFGAQTNQILQKLKVEFFSFKFGYMAVSDVDGHLLVSTHHLQNSEFDVLYLDIIHELVHVKQFMEGKELFNSEFEYVDNPTELEAYRYTVNEARRIGMTEEEIYEYLKVEWLNQDMHRRLVESVGLRLEKARC